MVELHPPLSGLPLGFVLALVVLEIFACFKRSLLTEGISDFLIGALLLSVLAAFLSGYQAVENAAQRSQEVLDAVSFHHLIGKIILCITVLCSVLRVVYRRATHGRKIFLFLYLGALFLGSGLIVYTGSLGGELVFRHGVAVDGFAEKHRAETE